MYKPVPLLISLPCYMTKMNCKWNSPNHDEFFSQVQCVFCTEAMVKEKPFISCSYCQDYDVFFCDVCCIRVPKRQKGDCCFACVKRDHQCLSSCTDGCVKVKAVLRSVERAKVSALALRKKNCAVLRPVKKSATVKSANASPPKKLEGKLNLFSHVSSLNRDPNT